MKKSQNKKKVSIKNILSIVATTLLVLAHVAIILVGIYAFRYYSIYPKLFIYIFVIIVCIFAILDIVLIVGLKYKDIIQKSIICALALFIIAGGCYGTYIMSQTNELVENVVQVDENDEQYETISGVFVSYKNDKYDKCESIEELKSSHDILIGALVETSEDSIYSAAIEELEKAGITDYKINGFTNNTDLLLALINNEVDIAVFSSMYQAVFKADENVDYDQYLVDIHEIDNFDKDVLVAANASKKDLSKDPFNVLLIGWSPVLGSTTIGLADAIIVASVNPQTYTVSMMSIARDSYVPISCYGGECDKINSGRGTSMDCFVKTVEGLIDEEIDFYMEVDFSAFADLCGNFGGIEIDNPVSFELDGVYVPAGHYIADGWQALEFARERHHMPNGDFDRQQHQKEVIMKLAEQFLNHSLSSALKIFNFISDRLKTNLTLKQLTSMFNMLTGTKNYTGLNLFNLIDMHALRITGYADWHYSEQYELPLWIYRLYQGSIDESLEHMQEVLGNYKTIEQNYAFGFNANSPYVREPFFSLSYDEEEIHETLPAYYPNFTKMTYEEALVWAGENGATLNPTFIGSNDPKYDESLEGMVVSQSIPYGKLVSKYPTCAVTVMGDGTIAVKLPEDYDGWSLDQAKIWCEQKKYKYDVHKYYVEEGKYEENEVVKMEIDDNEIQIYYAVYAPKNSTVKDGVFTCNSGYSLDSDTNTCKLSSVKVPNWVNKESPAKFGDTSASYDGINYSIVYETSETIAKNYVIRQSVAADSSIDPTKQTVTLTVSKGPECKHTNKKETSRTEATCESEGLIVYKCSDCGEEIKEPIQKVAHTWSSSDYISEVIDPTCEAAGYTNFYKKCAVCGTKGDFDHSGDETDALGHNFKDGECTRCGATDPNYIPPTPTPTDEEDDDGEEEENIEEPTK